MSTKLHITSDDVLLEEHSVSSKWNPNVPFHCTQEEFWEHIHSIEAGNFMSLEEFDKKFNAWKTEYLAKKCWTLFMARRASAKFAVSAKSGFDSL